MVDLPLGHRLALPGRFDLPVLLEAARPLGLDGAGGDECRVRLPDETLDEAVISAAQAAALTTLDQQPVSKTTPAPSWV